LDSNDQEYKKLSHFVYDQLGLNVYEGVRKFHAEISMKKLAFQARVFKPSLQGVIIDF